MAGISSKAAGGIQNRYKFNAGTELQSGEFSDGSGLELYATNYRSLDPQIGRFWQVDPLAEINYDNSPYAFASNNPILINDPTGLTDSVHKEVSTPKNPIVLDEIVVPGKKNSSNSGVDSWITALGWGGLGIDSYKNLLYKGDYMYKTSKGVVQSIFDTKWGANKTADELGNILNYSKNAQAAIRATKIVKLIKVGGKIIIIVSVAADIAKVTTAYLNNDPNASAIYAKAIVNTAITSYGLIPGVGWTVAGIYFAVDATIGWENAIPSYIQVEKNKQEMRDLKIGNFSDFKN